MGFLYVVEDIVDYFFEIVVIGDMRDRCLSGFIGGWMDFLRVGGDYWPGRRSGGHTHRNHPCMIDRKMQPIPADFKILDRYAVSLFRRRAKEVDCIDVPDLHELLG